MEAYEICILDDASHPLTIIAAAHVSDFSAVRSARKLAGKHAVEVWHGLECIYRQERPKPARPNLRTRH